MCVFDMCVEYVLWCWCISSTKYTKNFFRGKDSKEKKPEEKSKKGKKEKKGKEKKPTKKKRRNRRSTKDKRKETDEQRKKREEREKEKEEKKAENERRKQKEREERKAYQEKVGDSRKARFFPFFFFQIQATTHHVHTLCQVMNQLTSKIADVRSRVDRAQLLHLNLKSSRIENWYIVKSHTHHIMHANWTDSAIWSIYFFVLEFIP